MALVAEARWEWHVQNDHIVWSPELYRLYGLEPREFRPSYDAYLQRIHPSDRKRVQMIIAQAMRDGKPYDFEHRVIWPDGTERVVSAHGEVERDGHGRVVRMFGVSRDITPRRTPT